LSAHFATWTYYSSHIVRQVESQSGERYPKPLYYEQIGQQGRPMLFIPFDPTTIGSGCMKPHAFRAYRTVAVDLAGYGRSSR
jgi:pimeloyl-ACP methyl ester carboxylesterase